MQLNKGEVGAYILRHGRYRTTPVGLDRMIAKYLPASPNELREEVLKFNPDAEFSGSEVVSELLFILAEYNGFGLD